MIPIVVRVFETDPKGLKKRDWRIGERRKYKDQPDNSNVKKNHQIHLEESWRPEESFCHSDKRKKLVRSKIKINDI